MANLNYPEGRFYEAEFPELESIVVVQVRRIVDMGAYCTLLEYNGREAMLLNSELSKRRIRSLTKLLRVGRVEVCLCLRVDTDKGYIDLSKRRVDPDQKREKEEQFAKAKAVHGIMRHVASLNEVDVEDLCCKISWALQNKHGEAYEMFRKHVNEEVNLWDEINFKEPGNDLTDKMEKIKADFEVDLRRKLIQQSLRLRAKIEVACSEYEGVDAVREALLKGLEASKEDFEVKIQLIACPLFVLTCVCRDKQQGSAVLDKAMELIKDTIEAKGGTFAIKQRPTAGGQDDKDEDVGSDGDSEGGSDDTESDQDETMGKLDEKDLERLAAIKIEDDEDDA